MNRIAADILTYLGIVSDRALVHYGRSKLDGAPGPGSGRYPLGSGEDSYQHRGDFVSRVMEMKSKGMSEKDIADALGVTTTEYRSLYSRAVNERRATRIASARAMIADGKSVSEAARELGVNESTLRYMLKERTVARTNAAKETADFLRQQVLEKGMIDVGAGVDRELGISREKMQQALDILQEEGFEVWGGSVPQAANLNQETHLKVLCPEGTPHRDIYDYNNIQTITDYRMREDEDGNDVFQKYEYPASMDSGRLMIRYRDDVAPDGSTGIEKDGVIEIRRGVADLDLGESNYAQVRILVDDDHYLKGMAIYSDDLPDGVDVVFNTNKEPGQDALKKVKENHDPLNPFGSALRAEGGQYYYIDENGEKKLGLINKTRMEGDWDEWADKLPSQFLSKQSMQLIHRQLDISMADADAELAEISALTNPTVKKDLLMRFANECDGAAVTLKAAALPGQRYQVILPVAQLPDDEVYAPNYPDGSTVALIRYPHGGTFEIPIVRVNNKNPDAVRILGDNATDAVGINSNVAARLSGADFDGDTVMVIPCNDSRSTTKIISSPQLEGLVGFDPKVSYGYSHVEEDADGTKHYYRDGHEFKPMKNTQNEMGRISNLITDMTLQGASDEELARAVRHSMVVIDAEKHGLDYRQSEIDNDIAALRRLYQRKVDEEGNERFGGASTLISRAKGETTIRRHKGSPHIDPETGELIYKTDDSSWIDEKGKEHFRVQKSTQMAETKDARELSLGTPQEEAYAAYANHMKALANEARKLYLRAGSIKYSPSAKEAYRDEVDAMLTELELCLKNAPRERQAQLATASEINAMKKSNPDMKKKEISKRAQMALTRYREIFGAKRHKIELDERRWEAIQAGALSESRLQQVLRFADADKVRQYATPRTSTTLSTAKQARIRSMRANHYNNAEIAAALGISVSTVIKYGKEGAA